MSTETKKRILSAFVLISAILFCIRSGEFAISIAMFIFGVLIIDEIFCNIFNLQRFKLSYFTTQLVFVLPYFLFVKIGIAGSISYYASLINILALLQSLVLLGFLFLVKMDSSLINSLGRKFPYVVGVLVLFPFLSIISLFQYENWRFFIILLLLVNFGMDSGAWFFGKNFGKTKLWPVISPKKTIEGLLGGAFCSGILGLAFVTTQGNGNISAILFGAFLLLAFLSQCGDLVQSKLKRQADVKDASGLIPGHGGVYDRLDSLLFLSPFFVIMVNSNYFKLL